MPEKSVNEVARDARELYQKGALALQRQNFDYAIAIFQQVLGKEPAFFECRQALRATQFKKAGGSGGFFKKMLGGASSSPMIAKAQMARKNPIEALQILEQVLSSDPGNSMAHKMVADAAMEADFPRTAVLSLEILLKNSPRDYDLSMQYGEALRVSGQVVKAEAMYTELMRAHPNKPDIAEALKNLSARVTMEEGGYDALAEGKGSYRDILKNKDEAVQLEQEKRQVQSVDITDRLIKDAETRLAAEPRDLKLLRSLAEMNARKKDFDKALEYCQRIRATEGGADPSFERFAMEIGLKRFDHLISQLDVSLPEQAEQAAKIEAERAEFQLQECKSRADRYPTDLQIRFELGELYFKAGKNNEAIQEFQKAKNNPARKVASMGYLGQCFARRNMNDMAARQIQEA